MLTLTGRQSQQLVNILNLASAVLFLVAAIVPFITTSDDSPATVQTAIEASAAWRAGERDVVPAHPGDGSDAHPATEGNSQALR